MPRRGGSFADGYVYHVYNRGVNRQQIFFEPRTFIFFRSKLASYFSARGITALAYCLMPNHYHILVGVEDREALPRAMQGLQMSYSKAINRGYGRSGPLFQGPYSARQVSTAEGLLHLSRYIHLNPVRSGIVHEPQDWPHSSYRTFVGLEDSPWISAGDVLETLAPDVAREAQMSRYYEFVQREFDIESLTPGASQPNLSTKEKK